MLACGWQYQVLIVIRCRWFFYQEELASVKKKYERSQKIEQMGNSDEVLLEEIREYKVCQTCSSLPLSLPPSPSSLSSTLSSPSPLSPSLSLPPCLSLPSHLPSGLPLALPASLDLLYPPPLTLFPCDIFSLPFLLPVDLTTFSFPRSFPLLSLHPPLSIRPSSHTTLTSTL